MDIDEMDDNQHGHAADSAVRRQKKEDGKRMKRQRIDGAGGMRPRNGAPEGSETKKKRNDDARSIGFTKSNSESRKDTSIDRKQSHSKNHGNQQQKHRFGGVMDQVPCRNRPRLSTVSIAIPGSVVANGQTRELRTHLVGQIARAATIYHVDEIVVYDDKLTRVQTGNHFRSRPREANRNHSRRGPDEEKASAETTKRDQDDQNNQASLGAENSSDQIPRSSNVHEFTARLLQFCECPQYLRRQFFPMHPDLQFAGLLAPVDAPHHVRADDRCKYREGVVLEQTAPSGNSLVNCGVRGRPVEYVTASFAHLLDFVFRH
jgi:Putative RNA methyltransferase